MTWEHIWVQSEPSLIKIKTSYSYSYQFSDLGTVFRPLSSTVHREVEKVTKIGKIFSKPNFSTNNSRNSNQFSVPESPLPKLSNAH